MEETEGTETISEKRQGECGGFEWGMSHLCQNKLLFLPDTRRSGLVTKGENN